KARMGALPSFVLELAENLNINMPLRPGDERIVRPGWAAFGGAQVDPHHNVVQRFRLAPDEVAATVAEVRAIFAARGRTQISWEVGDSAEPKDLAERLIALGMKPFVPHDLSVGMVLTRPLEVGDSPVTVRRVE